MPVRRLLPVRGEDHVQGGHVARVAGVGELVEDDLGGSDSIGKSASYLI